MATENTLKWHTIELSDLSAEQQSVWAKMKETYKAYVTLRDAFEANVTATVSKALDARETDEVKFSYRFGQCSVALAPKSAPKSGKSTLRLK